MTHEDIDSNEQAANALVSALVDGELSGASLRRALRLLETSEAARAHWHACQVAGDVLRAPGLAAYAATDAAFVARLRERLHRPPPAVPLPVQAPPSRAMAAANDAGRPWKLAAGFASLAALAVLVWQLIGTGDQPASPQLAQREQAGASVGLAEADATGMLRDPRLDQLLAAHRQTGAASALQMPAGFLRNATYERSAGR